MENKDNKKQISKYEKVEKTAISLKDKPTKGFANKNKNKSFIITLILSIFLGFAGVHRFYVGKISTGLIWLFTFGLLGIGYITDIIVITNQTFEDINGNVIKV